MFDKVDVDGEEFEALKQFCFKIGEGRVEPQVEEIHFMHLYHPIVPEALFIVHWDRDHKQFYIREAIEGEGGLQHLEDLPLVHSFPLHGREIFPEIVEIQDETALYHYAHAPVHILHSIPPGYAIEAIPLKQYLRLKLCFDEINPIPWEER